MSNESDTVGRRSLAWFAVAFALCAAFSLTLYWRTLSYGFLSADDLTYVAKNPLTARLDPAHLLRMFSEFYFTDYLPVLHVFLAIQRAIFGSPYPQQANFDPSGYRAVSILLHALNGALLYSIFRAIRQGKHLHPAAILAGVAVFLAHPVQVENVAWIAEQKTLLSTALLLVSLWSYICYVRDGRPRWYILALAAGACAPFAKASAVVLPVILFSCDVLVLRQSWRRALVRTGPFLAATIAASITTVLSQAEGGAISLKEGPPLSVMFLTMMPVLTEYVRMVILPRGLAYFYHVPLRESVLDASVLVGMMLLLAYMFCVWRIARRRPNILFWLLWPAVALAPVSNIVPLNTLMADRYLYVPLLGVGGLVAVGLGSLHHAAWLNARSWRFSLAAATIVVIMFSILTIDQTRWWKDDRVMWRHALIHAPQRWKPWYHAALATRNDAAALQETKPDVAAALFRSAARTFHECTRRFGPDPRTLAALGTVLWESGLREEAIVRWLEALQMAPHDATIHAKLGAGYYHLGRIEQSVPHLQRALQNTDHFPELRAQIPVLKEMLEKAQTAMSVEPPAH